MIAASVFTLFALALLAPLVVRVAGRASGWVLALAPLTFCAWYASNLTAIGNGAVITPDAIEWVPQLGLAITFRLDGLALLFALMILGIGTLVVAYAGDALAGHPQLGRFMAFLIAFMASMLGVVVSDNLLLLFIFWELTSITSYLLIGFNNDKEESRRSALQALLVTGLGGLALLAGVVCLGLVAQTFEISEMLERADEITASPWYPAILILVLLGAATKSAQFPFHFWLPNAMAAPAPVSAYLHSSTMVKAGVFLLARLAPVLGATTAWTTTLTILGAATMLYAGVLALRSVTFKRVLAYTTVSALGTMVLLIGTGSPGDGALAAFILAHAIYKGGLFMCAGAIEHVTATKDTRRVTGLLRTMPLTSIALLLGALSMAGIPILFGAPAKELAKKSVTATAHADLLLAAIVASGALFTAAALIVALRPVFARHPHPPNPADPAPTTHKAGAALVGAPLLLGILGLVAGIAPALFIEPLVRASTLATTGAAFEATAKLGAVPLVALKWLIGPSALAVAIGIALYALRTPFGALAERADTVLARIAPPALYQYTLDAALALAGWQTRTLQSGSIGRYIRVTVLGGFVIVGALVWHTDATSAIAPAWEQVKLFDGALIAMIVLAALGAAMVRTRLAAVAALGVAGLGITLVFITFSAPDVAMTQFAVETLTVLVFVLAFYKLPQFRRLTLPSMRIWELTVSLLFGLGMTSLVLIATSESLAPTISTFFSENAAPQAYGRNIVNVILVDFRAADTFGEILVLALSAIGISALLKLRTQNNNDNATEAAQ